MAEFQSYEEMMKNVEEMAKNVAEKALDEILYDGKSIREWMQVITTQVDAISRESVIEYIEASEADLGHDSENELVCQDIKELPSVNPQPKTDVLDKIRAEIEELDVLRFSSGERIYKDEVLDIIDKYRTEK